MREDEFFSASRAQLGVHHHGRAVNKLGGVIADKVHADEAALFRVVYKLAEPVPVQRSATTGRSTSWEGHFFHFHALFDGARLRLPDGGDPRCRVYDGRYRLIPISSFMPSMWFTATSASR